MKGGTPSLSKKSTPLEKFAKLLQDHQLGKSYGELNVKFAHIDLFDQSKIAFKSSGRIGGRQNIKWILKLDSQDVIRNAPPKPDEIGITDPLRGYFRDIKFINELLIEEGTDIGEQAFNQKEVAETSNLGAINSDTDLPLYLKLSPKSPLMTSFR